MLFISPLSQTHDLESDIKEGAQVEVFFKMVPKESEAG